MPNKCSSHSDSSANKDTVAFGNVCRKLVSPCTWCRTPCTVCQKFQNHCTNNSICHSFLWQNYLFKQPQEHHQVQSFFLSNQHSSGGPNRSGRMRSGSTIFDKAMHISKTKSTSHKIRSNDESCPP